MARSTDNHPDPNDPAEGVTPKFPPGLGPIKTITPQPGVIRPGNDVPAPARDPFPDHTPDPGVRKP